MNQEIKDAVVASILEACPNFPVTGCSKLKDIAAYLRSAGLTKIVPNNNLQARTAILSQYDRITGGSSLKEYLEERKKRGLARKEKRARNKKQVKKNKKKTYKRPLTSHVKITKFDAKESDEDFLDSWAWKKLRYEVLKEYGRRCMCCGATPETGTVICVDHIKPRHTHPELKLVRNNLQVLCYDCNKGKGAWDETDWRPKTLG